MKVYHNTKIYCNLCRSELLLVEDINYNDIDGDIYKDAEHYFECPNNCDLDFEEIIPNHDDEINRIIGGG